MHNLGFLPSMDPLRIRTANGRATHASANTTIGMIVRVQIVSIRLSISSVFILQQEAPQRVHFTVASQNFGLKRLTRLSYSFSSLPSVTGFKNLECRLNSREYTFTPSFFGLALFLVYVNSRWYGTTSGINGIG